MSVATGGKYMGADTEQPVMKRIKIRIRLKSSTPIKILEKIVRHYLNTIHRMLQQSSN
jgi:DNA-directed RNA polymerase subunit L